MKSADDALGVCKPWKSKTRRNKFKRIWFERFIIGRILYHHAICGYLSTKSNMLRSLDYGCVKKPNLKKVDININPFYSYYCVTIYHIFLLDTYLRPTVHLPLDGGGFCLIQPTPIQVQSDGTTLEVIGVRMPDVWGPAPDVVGEDPGWEVFFGLLKKRELRER